MESVPIDTGIIDTSKLREKWKPKPGSTIDARFAELERRIDDLVRLINILSSQERGMTKEEKEKLDELDTAS